MAASIPPTVLEWSKGLASLGDVRNSWRGGGCRLTRRGGTAISAYLADPSAPAVLEIGKSRVDVAAAVLAHQWLAEELAVEDATPARRRNAARTAVLLAPVG